VKREGAGREKAGKKGKRGNKGKREVEKNKESGVRRVKKSKIM